VVKVKRTPDADELPALVRQAIAEAIRNYYEACYLLNGPSCQHVILHSEADDPMPITALLIVVPENHETAAWIESVNRQAAHSWDTLQEWARILTARMGSDASR
jgi:hypothetical protein